MEPLNKPLTELTKRFGLALFIMQYYDYCDLAMGKYLFLNKSSYKTITENMPAIGKNMKKRTINVSETFFQEDYIGNEWFFCMVNVKLHLKSKTSEFVDYFYELAKEYKLKLERGDIAVIQNSRVISIYTDIFLSTEIKDQILALSEHDDFALIDEGLCESEMITNFNLINLLSRRAFILSIKSSTGAIQKVGGSLAGIGIKNVELGHFTTHL